jgi:pimeloyl-ACP methyl ester carboxylesterase
MIARYCLALCLLVVGATLATVQFWIPALIFRPTPLEKTDPAAWGLRGAVPMQARYGDGTSITGWWVRPPKPGSPVVLIVHGRSSNISTRAPVMKRLAADGMGVLMFDYRGYGASTGQPSELHLSTDTLTAYRWLREQGISPESIVVVGQSLGNSPATMLAAHQPIAALLLVSPFTNLPDAIGERLPWLPVRLLPWMRNRFDVSDGLRLFSGPTLLVASEADGLVPIGNARQLQNLAPRALWLDASPLHHDGMLRSLADDGRLTEAIGSLVFHKRPLQQPRR